MTTPRMNFTNLQAVVDRSPLGILITTARDWNALTGRRDTNTRHVLGSFTIGDLYVNNDRLVNFAAINRMTVSKEPSCDLVFKCWCYR